MRKAIPCLLLLLLLLACAPALAETYVFDQLYATMEMPEGYIVANPRRWRWRATGWRRAAPPWR